MENVLETLAQVVLAMVLGLSLYGVIALVIGKLWLTARMTGQGRVVLEGKQARIASLFLIAVLPGLFVLAIPVSILFPDPGAAANNLFTVVMGLIAFAAGVAGVVIYTRRS